MADSIRETLENQALRKTIIQGGIKHTSEHFDNRELVARLGDIFQNQLDSRQITAS